MTDPEIELLLAAADEPVPAWKSSAALRFVPEPWHGRITARRYRRWRHASSAVVRHNAKLAPTARTLNFYPMRPQPQAPLSVMLKRLGIRIGYAPGARDATIAWDGDTWFSRRAARRLPAEAINRRCLDVSKSTVERAWRGVSGRTLALDPRTTHEQMVMKPEENGRHGGRLVQGPIDRPRRGWVYERLIDWREGDWVRQTRAVIIGRQVVLAYEKWRRYPDLFFGTRLTLPCEPSKLYTENEQALLVKFAGSIGMDYGELDILRDPIDGEIYVVDANRTPSHPHELPADYFEAAFGPMTAAFEELLLKPRGL